MAGVAAPMYRSSLGVLRAPCRLQTVAARAPRLVRSSRSLSTCAPWSRRPGALIESQRRRCEVGWARGFKRDPGAEGTEPAPPSFAFAFDIDGVLLHVAKPIPGAPEVLRFLNDYNIPFILLTNGGGKPEAERVRDLSERLGVPLSTDNFVQSHTPFRDLLEGPDSLRDKTVLVTGSDYEKCRGIFKHYGFKNVITPADIYAADPTVFPFQAASSYTAPSQPLPKPLYHPTTTATPTAAALSAHLKIDAMFVLNDPRDWALDIQIITDLLLSHAGYLGTYSARNGDAARPHCGWQDDAQPPLYFSNADLVWSANYPLPRLGQGAFQAAVAGLWRRITGGHELRRTSIGKPYGETYRFAERVLAGHRHEVLRRMGLAAAAAAAPDAREARPPRHEPAVGALRAVYMVGDNPESDIAGANGHVSEHGTEWVSVLVKTGVWSEARGAAALRGRFEPRAVVDDVTAAVRWALRREGWGAEGLERLK